MRKDSKGLTSFTLIFRANEGEPQSRELFAVSAKEARISVEASLQKEFGWDYIIRSIEPTEAR